MNDKLIKSALIAGGGVLITALPILIAEISDYITVNDPVDWRTPLAMLVTGVGTWVVNTIRVYIKTE